MNARKHGLLRVTDIPYLVGMMIASVVLLTPLPGCNQADDMVFHDPHAEPNEPNEPSEPVEPDLPPLTGAGQDVSFTSTNYVSDGNDDLGGYAVGRGFSIQWGQSGNADAAEVAEVLDATIDRLSHLQRTNLASDKQARILWDLTQARENIDE